MRVWEVYGDSLARGHSSIKVAGREGGTLRFLPRVVWQLKMLRRADTNVIFGTQERRRYPILGRY